MIKKLICATMVALSFGVVAKPVLQLPMADNSRVVLYDEPRNCPAPRLYFEYINEGSQPRTVRGCWAIVQLRDGVSVHLLDEEGDEGMLAPEYFQPIQWIRG